ncbi:MAG: RNA-binding cell elongation regulator Jag/EloR [Eubacteriales bacterium]|nr:RNA-binding cell elongation regulator Jag/EloR [Eubacteriales bacterium]
MKSLEKSAKTVDEAVMDALVELDLTSDQVDVEVLEEGSKGILGLFGTKLARVRVTQKIDLKDVAKDFLNKLLKSMDLDSNIVITEEDKNTLMINLEGDQMGVLIGKRGQTLDSIQYLTSLVVNKYSDHYIRIKMDTEDYRNRRRKTLESLANNLAMKVKKTGKKFTLEPMSPNERRIIHSTLQKYKFIETHSEGEEPFRRVVIVPKKKVVE